MRARIATATATKDAPANCAISGRKRRDRAATGCTSDEGWATRGGNVALLRRKRSSHLARAMHTVPSKDDATADEFVAVMEFQKIPHTEMIRVSSRLLRSRRTARDSRIADAATEILRCPAISL
jgi:hypothetical protein